MGIYKPGTWIAISQWNKSSTNDEFVDAREVNTPYPMPQDIDVNYSLSEDVIKQFIEDTYAAPSNPVETVEDTQKPVEDKREIINLKYEKLKYLTQESITSELAYTDYISLYSTYNKYIKSYEEKISTNNIYTHDTLLSFLNYFLWTKGEENIYDPKLSKSNNSLKTFSFEELNESYFTEKIFKNNYSIIDSEILDSINKSYLEKDFFPFFNSINISYYKESRFANFLEAFNLKNEFLIYITSLVSIYKNDSTDKFLNEFLYKDKKIIINDEEEKFNLSLKNFFDLFKFKPMKKNFYYFNRYLNDITLYTTSYNKLIKNEIYYKIFSDILANQFSKNLLSFNKEILAFQIEKKFNNTEISNHFFLNSQINDNFEFIDTQIKYGEEYEYNIYGFMLITDSGPPFISKVKLNSDSIFLSVKDSPPVAPFFNVFIDRNQKNTIIFTVDQSAGNATEQFIPLDGSDISQENILFKNDDYPKKIELFRLETQPNSYKDFKNADLFLSNKMFISNQIIPNKFYYFTLRSVDVHNQFSNPSYVAKIKLVKEEGYEYLEIIPYATYSKTKIIDQDKVISTLDPWIINQNSINKQKDTTFKKFKKYLQIKPSDTQILLQNLKNVLPEDALKIDDINNSYDREIFGQEQQTQLENLPKINSIFNKKYKLRIKSKNSGKIIDLNFSYKLKKQN